MSEINRIDQKIILGTSQNYVLGRGGHSVPPNRSGRFLDLCKISVLKKQAPIGVPK
jgi:hypothetical protein